MANSQRYLFHVGMPKSASTTLQKGLFTNVPNINNFALYPTNNVAGSNSLPSNSQSIYLNDPHLFEFYKSLHNKPEVGVAELRSMWDLLYQQHAKFDINLLSHEAMTSAFFSSIPVSVKLERIKAVFPKTHIIIVVRDQLSWLHSQYTDHPFQPTNLGNGPSCSFDEWVQCFLEEPKLKAGREALDYYCLVTRCCGLFGQANVTVIRLEWLKEQPHRFYSAWAQLLGVTPEFVKQSLDGVVENRGLSRIYNNLRQKQRKDKLAGRTNSWNDRLLKTQLIKHYPKAEYVLSEPVEQAVKDYYSRSNASLSSLMNW